MRFVQITGFGYSPAHSTKSEITDLKPISDHVRESFQIYAHVRRS
jgi:hypothetical protein